jgi:hypothetical protein
MQQFFPRWGVVEPFVIRMRRMGFSITIWPIPSDDRNLGQNVLLTSVLATFPSCRIEKAILGESQSFRFLDERPVHESLVVRAVGALAASLSNHPGWPGAVNRENDR